MDIPTKPVIALEALAALSAQVQTSSTGAAGTGDGFTWETRLTPAHGGTWVETRLTTTRELSFSPAMVVWLGRLDNLDDRQAHTWRQTILRAPTTNQQGLGGNDLPAAYLYDHEQQQVTICYCPPDALRWAPHRFYELAVREVIQYRPTPRYGLGVLPLPAQAAFTFAPGTHEFRFWYCQYPVEAIPSEWEAQTALLAEVSPLLDPVPSLRADAPGWAAMARGTLADLQDPACWVTANGVTGLRAYVLGSSAVGRGEGHSFELMTQLDVLLPLLHWRGQTGDTGADATIARLLDAVRAYRIIEPHDYVSNHYPYQQTDTFMDTWYFYENVLIKLPWVAHLSGDADLRQTFFAALAGGRKLAHNTHYLLPLFADADGWTMRGSLRNASVSGLYAAGCVLAYQLDGDPAHLAEARAALDTLRQLPPHLLTHEPQQLSFSAAAAAFLGDLPLARDFVNLSLRMAYWGKDPAVPFYDPRGMFQACASLCYPAYKENVEVIWAWSELLRADASAGLLPAGLLAAFANLQRCHNYAFFDPFLPEPLRRGPCPYVPYEDLATAEFTHTATLGKELYGAGEVFWSALLFAPPDFLGDLPPDVLAFSLDVPCLRLTGRDTPPRRWLLYNPRQTPVTLHSASTTLELAPNSYQIVEGV